MYDKSFEGSEAMQHGWHGHECGCGAGRGCGEQRGCGRGEEKPDKMAELMATVKEAKECLLKDKIKAKLEAKIGTHLDALADVAVEMLTAKWEIKKEMKEKKQVWKEKLEGMMKN